MLMLVQFVHVICKHNKTLQFEIVGFKNISMLYFISRQPYIYKTNLVRALVTAGLQKHFNVVFYLKTGLCV